MRSNGSLWVGDGAGLLSMANGDRGLGDAFRDLSRDVRCDWPDGRELADAVLGRDLPCRRGTDMGLLGGTGDGIAGSRGERRLDPVMPCPLEGVWLDRTLSDIPGAYRLSIAQRSIRSQKGSDPQMRVASALTHSEAAAWP